MATRQTTLLIPSILRLYSRFRRQIPPPHAPPSPPAKPSLLGRGARKTHNQSSTHESHARTTARDPAGLGIQAISGSGAHQLAAEDADHVGGVDAIPSLGRDGVDGGAVGDLRGLQADVDGEGLDDGAGDGEGAGVGADEDADETHQFAEDDGQEGHEAVDDEA